MDHVKIPRSLLRRAVKALRDQAAFEASISQAPYLIRKEDTQEWKDAKQLDALLREPGEHCVGDEDEE